MTFASCVISGTVTDTTGTGIEGAMVRVRLGGMSTDPAVNPYPVTFWPLQRDVVIDDGKIVASRAVTVFTSSLGAWSVTLPVGAAFFLEIPAADVYHVGTVPSDATANAADLIPTMRRYPS